MREAAKTRETAAMPRCARYDGAQHDDGSHLAANQREDEGFFVGLTDGHSPAARARPAYTRARGARSRAPGASGAMAC